MSLRQNALALAVLTVLMAIVGDWSGDPDLARLWYLALAVLLLGLAYEGWVMMRTGLGVAISASKPRCDSRPAGGVADDFTHRLARTLTLEIAADSPATVEIDGEVRTLVVPAGAGASMSLTAIPRRLGSADLAAIACARRRSARACVVDAATGRAIHYECRA